MVKSPFFTPLLGQFCLSLKKAFRKVNVIMVRNRGHKYSHHRQKRIKMAVIAKA
jgi:hypothetical protein